MARDRRSPPGRTGPRGRPGSRGARPPAAAGGSPLARPVEPRSTEPPPGFVLLAEFGRAHGLRGEIRLKSHTGNPLAVASYGPLRTRDGRAVVLETVRQAAGDQPDLLVARVEGVTTREAADALNRVGLYVPRERLGEADEDEFFLADLIGLSARTEAGDALGPIVGVPNYGGGDLLEIAPERGPTLLVPFTKLFVPAIDIPGGFVTVSADALRPDEPEDDAPPPDGDEDLSEPNVEAPDETAPP